MSAATTMFDLEQFDPHIEAPSETVSQLVGERLALGKKRKRLEDDLDTCIKSIAALDQRILPLWEQEETNHISQGGSVLYMHTSRYAKVLDEENLHRALAAAGLGAIVKETVNRMTLTAALKELEDTSGVPEVLNGVVEIGRQIVLRQKNAR